MVDDISVIRFELRVELRCASQSLPLLLRLTTSRVTATVVHTLLFFRHFRQCIPFGYSTVDISVSVWKRKGTALLPNDRDEDVHARIMARYPQVPVWWFTVLFLLTLALSIAATTAYPTGLPVWALLIAIVVAGVMVLPVGLVQAMTNLQVGLNVIVS